jgi:hypothetical protein
MGFMRPQPEAEGLVLAHLGEEVIEVRRVIPVGNTPEGRLHPSAVEFRAGRVGLSTSRLEPSGTPALAGKPGGVTRVLQQFRVGCELSGQGAVDVARFLQAPDRLAGQDGASRWPAGGRVAKSVIEVYALTGDTVEGGRLDHLIMGGPGVGIGLVV